MTTAYRIPASSTTERAYVALERHEVYILYIVLAALAVTPVEVVLGLADGTLALAEAVLSVVAVVTCLGGVIMRARRRTALLKRHAQAWQENAELARSIDRRFRAAGSDTDGSGTQ